MEKAVWVCACALALLLAAGLSSMSSAQRASPDNNLKSFEIKACEPDKACELRSEMFLRKVKRTSRRAFA